MVREIWERDMAADKVTKVIGSFLLSRLDDGNDPSQEHPLTRELLNVFLGCCAPSLVRISIIDAGTLSELTGFAGVALVTLKPESIYMGSQINRTLMARL